MKFSEINWKVTAAIVIFVVSGGAVYLIPNFSSYMYALFEKIQSLGLWGFVLFSLLYGLCMILTIPVSMATISLSFLYDFLEANIICNIGTAIGIAGSYILGNTLLKECCQDMLNYSEATKSLANTLKDSEWKFAFWVHQLSVPIAMKNYGLTSIGMGFAPYFTVGMITSVLSNAMYIFLGGKFQKIVDEVREGEFITWEMGFFLTSLVACIAGCAAITMMVHSAMLKEQKYEVVSI